MKPGGTGVKIGTTTVQIRFKKGSSEPSSMSNDVSEVRLGGKKWHAKSGQESNEISTGRAASHHNCWRSCADDGSSTLSLLLMGSAMLSRKAWACDLRLGFESAGRGSC